MEDKGLKYLQDTISNISKDIKRKVVVRENDRLRSWLWHGRDFYKPIDAEINYNNRSKA